MTRKDVDATSDQFAAYDQVARPSKYRLSESETDPFDHSTTISTVDVGPALCGGEAERRRFAQELGEALEEIGFAVLAGHGIDEALFDRVDDANRSLFETHSLETKLRYRATRHGSVNQGYFPLEETSEIHPDLVEGWVFCRRAFRLPDQTPDLSQFWPDPSMEPVARELVEANHRLILPVMQAILRYFGDDPTRYDEALARPNLGLRFNYYPALEAEPPGGRLLGHEDVGMFTFLPAATVEGLQVLNRRNGKWVRLHPPRGSIILNTGDYVQRITNDRLPSTTHRVSVPRDASRRQSVRVSSPMNVYVWEDHLLEVLPTLGPAKYPPIRALPFHTQATSKFYGDDYAVTEDEA